ncbi:MAG: hypothetical protein ABC360_05325 [Acetomicrobium sp.]
MSKFSLDFLKRHVYPFAIQEKKDPDVVLGFIFAVPKSNDTLAKLSVRRMNCPGCGRFYDHSGKKGQRPDSTI